MKRLSRSNLVVIALCAWCISLVAVRVLLLHEATYVFLLWNLFLACVPALAAAALDALSSLGRGRLGLKALVFAIWLAFLPNAPYIVTDFIHLAFRPPVPLLFDVVLLSSFAATGVLLGYFSVLQIERVIARDWGRRAAAFVAYSSLALSGVGVYLGRFLRWNSWDVVSAPGPLFGQLAHGFADPLSHSRAWVVSALFGVVLMLGYAGLRRLRSA